MNDTELNRLKAELKQAIDKCASAEWRCEQAFMQSDSATAWLMKCQSRLISELTKDYR